MPSRARRDEGAHAGDADAEVAGEGQLDAAAVDAAVQRGDGRGGEGLERVAEPGQRVVGPVGARDVAEADAGAEAPAAAGEDEGARSSRPAQSSRSAVSAAHGGQVEGVVRLGAVRG